MLPIRQVTLDDLYEGGISKQSLAQPIEHRGEASNGHAEEDASRAQDTMCLTQCHEAVSTLSQVIQRAKQEHDIDARVSTVQMARVTDLDPCQRSVRLCLGSLPGLFHVQGVRINQMHFIALS